MAEGGDNPTRFVLDLDSSEFLKSGNEALGVIREIGETENLSGLLLMLGELGIAMAAVKLAVYAFKEALDLTTEGEELARVNKQFETLGQQAGISTEKLKSGLEEAAGGLVSTADLLKAANAAIVQMGASASKLPEIMELARKVTAVMGGDVQTNFQEIARAIEMGNARMLKHLGINIDTTKAMQAMAKQIGVTTEELSKEGQQQAILNAVLEQAHTKFKDVSEESGTVKTNIIQLHVAWREFTEGVAAALSTTLGPIFKSVFQGIAEAAHKVGTALKEQFGSGAEKAQAHAEGLRIKIKELQDQLNTMEERQKSGSLLTKIFGGGDEKIIAKVKADLADYQEQLRKLDSQAAEHARNEAAADAAKEKHHDQMMHKDVVNQDILRRNNEKFQKEILKLDEQTAKAKEQFVNSEADIERAIQARQIQAERQHQQALEAIKAQYNANDHRRIELMAAEDRRYQAQVRADETQTEQLRQKLTQTYVTQSKTALQGVERAAHQMSQKAKADLADMGAFGTAVMADFQKNSMAAFEQIGTSIAQGQNIADSAAQAMKGFFLNMLGDRAEAEGELLLLSGIWPPNPLAIAAGGGLVALGAALKSMAGAASSGVSVSGSIASPGQAQSAGIPTGSSPASTPPQTASDATDQQQAIVAAQQQTPQRNVVINVQGHLLDTQGAQRTLMELMRAETDATSFTYNQIGV